MLENDVTALDEQLLNSPHILGRECMSCGRILKWGFFRKDSSCREGYREQCVVCESTPKLSLQENLAMIREKNYNSEAVKKQRFDHQEEYENEAARIGKAMNASDFLLKLHSVVPSLYITEGNIVGNLAMYRVYPQPQERLGGRDFEYIGFCPMGLMPEFSTYIFDEKDVPIREKQRGWRSVLIRLILNGMLSEEVAEKTFGKAEGAGASVYNRKLYQWRNRKNK